MSAPGTTTRITCPSCGSDDVHRDAAVSVNTGELHTYDNLTCVACGYDGHSFNETEVLQLAAEGTV